MKKFLAVLLVAVMVLGMLAACNQEKPEETKVNDTPKQTQPKETDPKPTEKEDPVHLKWMTYGAIQDQAGYAEVMEAFNKLLLEKINVTVELVGVPHAEITQKADLAMSSGEAYDIMWVSNWVNDYATLVRKEALLPLEDLLAEYGQELTASLNPAYLEMCKINGVQYAVPCIQTMNEQQAILIQKQYADEFGLTTRHIEDISELDEFFAWFVKKYPDMYGHNFAAGSLYLAANYESLGGGCYINKYDPTNVVWDVAYKLANEMNYKYVENGFLPANYATRTDTSADMAANRFVAYQYKNKIGIEAELESRHGVEWVCVAIGDPYLPSTASRATALAIPYTSEHPEAAMKLLNLIYTDKEVYNALMFGVEGKHYNKVDENRVELIDDGGWNLTSTLWCYGNTYNGFVYGSQQDDIHRATQAMNDSSMASPVTGFSFDTTPVAAEIAQVNAVNTEFKMFSFYENHDELYQEWKDKMISAGIGTIVAECQRQLDEWRAATGK